MADATTGTVMEEAMRMRTATAPVVKVAVTHRITKLLEVSDEQ